MVGDSAGISNNRWDGRDAYMRTQPSTHGVAGAWSSMSDAVGSLDVPRAMVVGTAVAAVQSVRADGMHAPTSLRKTTHWHVCVRSREAARERIAATPCVWLGAYR